MPAKVLLFYRFTPIADPETMRLWQRDLCEGLGLRGRIVLSPHGINGTLGGDLAALKRYVRKTREHAALRDLDVSWSTGSGLDDEGHSLDFPRLRVRVRDEIVAFGTPDALRVDEHGVVGCGEHLTPSALRRLLDERDDVVLFDGRNAFEAAIGRFRGAIVPDVATTREIVAELDAGRYDDLKRKPVVTYCTGGIRCEVLSSLMRDRGFEEVYQLEGGIVRYGEAFGNAGLWEGSLAVFDARESMTFGDDAVVVGRCAACEAPTSRLVDCTDERCQRRVVLCEACGERRSCDEHAGVAA